MAPGLSDDDSRTASFPHKRARGDSYIEARGADAPSISPTKRRKKATVGKQNVQDFVPQGSKFNAHGDVLANDGVDGGSGAWSGEAGSVDGTLKVKDGKSSGASSSCPTSGDASGESESDRELREKIHKVETDYWADRISRDVYNEERFKLYTEDEVKEACIEWPRREVYSPAGYRENEFESMAQGMYGGPSWDDVLFEFGCPPAGRGDEEAAKERWRDEIERKFKDPGAKKAEYRRWERIREVETEYYHHRISRDEYNERRFALYTEKEREEKGVVWPHEECQSPAGYRDDVFEQFVRDEPDWETRMEFHWPFALHYTDTIGEENRCELCVPLIEEHKIVLKEQEEKREAWRKAEKEKREAEKLLEKQRIEKKREERALAKQDAEKRREEKAKAKAEQDKLAAEQEIQPKQKKKKKKKKKQAQNVVGAPDSVQKTAETEQTERGSGSEILEARLAGSADSSRDEGEVSEGSKPDKADPPFSTNSTQSQSNISLDYSPPGPSMAPIRLIRDLNNADRELQLRYFPPGESAGGNGDGNRPIRCLVCAGEGHVAEVCRELECHTCGAADSHFTYACPKTVRCEKCHEAGHAIASCPSKLVRSAVDGLFCTLCQQDGHSENMCSRIWRTTFPSDTPMRKVDRLPIYCYSCGDEGHFGADCFLQRGAQPAESLLGGSTFSMKNAQQFLSNGYKPEVRLEFSIRGRATHQIREDSESEEFLRPPIMTNMQDRRPDIRFRGSDRSGRDNMGRPSDRSTYGQQGSGYHDRGPPRQERPLANNNYRPPPRRQRSPSPLPRYQRDDRRDYARERDGSRTYSGMNDRYQPPLPREQPPPSRGRGESQRVGSGESYRPLPSAARNAKRQFRR